MSEAVEALWFTSGHKSDTALVTVVTAEKTHTFTISLPRLLHSLGAGLEAVRVMTSEKSDI